MEPNTLDYLKIFGGSSHPTLTTAICKKLGVPQGKLRIEKFSNGEKYIQLLESVRGCNCFVVQTSTGNVNEEYMELFLILDALRRSLAKYIHVVIPHFGYARQDRIAEPREPISAKLMANLIESAGAKHIITLRLHSDQIQGFFEKPVDNLPTKKLFAEYLKKKKLKDLVIVSPDAGGAKSAEKFARTMDAPLAILHKSRPAHNQAEIQHVIGDVKGRTAIIYDDMVDTAGSVVAAAAMLQQQGARDIYLIATHAVLSGPAITRLKQAPFKEIIFTDSIPHDYSELPNVKILSITELMAKTILGIHEGRSISKHWDMSQQQ